MAWDHGWEEAMDGVGIGVIVGVRVICNTPLDDAKYPCIASAHAARTGGGTGLGGGGDGDGGGGGTGGGVLGEGSKGGVEGRSGDEAKGEDMHLSAVAFHTCAVGRGMDESM